MPDDPHYQPDNPEASPISGYIPPVHTRWKPGQSGNPRGRARSAGTSMKEWLNQFAESELTEAELSKIARDKSAPWTKRMAAERIVIGLESGDLADFEEVISGKKTLKELREQGVNTTVIKKIKPTELGNELEIRDRSGEEFDRIMDRTLGRPETFVDLDAKKTDGNELLTPDPSMASAQIPPGAVPSVQPSSEIQDDSRGASVGEDGDIRET